MARWRLFRWVLVRGIASGAILGILYAEIVFSIYVISGYFAVCFLSLIVGALFGAGLGSILGGVNGLALVVLTHFFAHPIHNRGLYRWSALLVAVICTLPTSFISAYVLFGNLAYVYLPVMVLAAVAAVYFAWRLPDAATPTEGKSRPATAVLFYIEK